MNPSVANPDPHGSASFWEAGSGSKWKAGSGSGTLLDPGVKKAPDPGSGSATLTKNLSIFNQKIKIWEIWSRTFITNQKNFNPGSRFGGQKRIQDRLSSYLVWMAVVQSSPYPLFSSCCPLSSLRSVIYLPMSEVGATESLGFFIGMKFWLFSIQLQFSSFFFLFSSIAPNWTYLLFRESHLGGKITSRFWLLFLNMKPKNLFSRSESAFSWLSSMRIQLQWN